MIPEERAGAILKLISEKKYVTIPEIQKLLYVSAPTARRDLSELAKRGLIVRSAGGAIANQEYASYRQILPDSDPAQQIRTAMARQAASLVSDGSIIYLHASAHVLAMTEFLRCKKGLTVVTNSTAIMDALSDTDIHLYCCGGDYVERSAAFCGDVAARMVEHFNFDTAFLSCRGLTPEHRLSFASSQFMRLLGSALRNADRKVLLCDRDRIGVRAPFNLFSLDQMDTVITDDTSGQLESSQLEVMVVSL
jgi:DeoR/GlpR family transcriptional regulator of sugar metabolism